MNERIRELAEQAMGTRKHVPPVWQFYDIELEKFAELIVRECIDEIEFQYGGGRELEDGTHSKDWDEAIECVSAMVKKHFGVE